MDQPLSIRPIETRLTADDYLDYRGCRETGTLRSPLIEWDEREQAVRSERGIVSLIGRARLRYESWRKSINRLNALLPEGPP